MSRRSHKREVINSKRESRCKKEGCKPKGEGGRYFWGGNFGQCEYCGKPMIQNDPRKKGRQ